MVSVQADTGKHVAYPLILFLPRGADLMCSQWFCYNIMHRHSCIQRGIWILKDHLHLFSDRQKLLLIQIRDIFSINQNFTGCRFIDTDNGTGTGTFSASAFSDQPECFTPQNRKTHIIYCMNNFSTADGKMLRQPFNLKNGYLFIHFSTPFRSFSGLSKEGASLSRSQHRLV